MISEETAKHTRLFHAIQGLLVALNHDLRHSTGYRTSKAITRVRKLAGENLIYPIGTDLIAMRDKTLMNKIKE